MIEIYNEEGYIKELLEHGIHDDNWRNDCTLLAKFYRDENYKKAEVKKILKEKCEKYCASYKPNKGDYKKIDKLVTKVFRKDSNGEYIEKIRKITGITTTKEVVQWFLDLEENFTLTKEQVEEEKKRRPKVSIKTHPINFNRIKYLFTLYVWTKIQEYYLERPNIHYLTKQTSQFKKSAGLKSGFSMVNERNFLYDLGFIDINHAIGVIPVFMDKYDAFKVPVTEENKVVLSIDDMHECGEWILKQKMGSFVCQNCGREFANYSLKDKGGRPRKYCRECAAKMLHSERSNYLKEGLCCIDCGKPINVNVLSIHDGMTKRCVNCQKKYNEKIKLQYEEKRKKTSS